MPQSPVAHGVAGPILLCAVAWTLQQAERDGVESLYFAARDGELPVQIAQRLQSTLGIGSAVTCRYLYGSRRAWQVHDDQALVGYLAQEGLLSGCRSAVVDVGWLGRAVAGLVRVIAAEGHEPPDIYLLGGLCGEQSADAPEGARSFLIDARGRNSPDQPALVHLLESFCAGGEGTTIGFAAAGDAWVPVLAAKDNTAALTWGLRSFQQAVLEYVDIACDAVTPADLREVSMLVPQLIELCRLLWTAPSRAEAAAWASCPFDNPAGSSVETLARRPSTRDLASSARHPSRARQALATGPWTAGAAALLGIPRMPAVSRHVIGGLRLRAKQRAGRRADLGLPTGAADVERSTVRART